VTLNLLALLFSSEFGESKDEATKLSDVEMQLLYYHLYFSGALFQDLSI
jgi:hypothetical protein